MSVYEDAKAELANATKTWLVTGAGGFIGSNLVQSLLMLDQTVVGLDNFKTGRRQNLDEVRELVGQNWSRFEMIEGDICDPQTCQRACQRAQIVLHQAALGSVPRSLSDPLATHQANVNGFLNMLIAVREARIKRFRVRIEQFGLWRFNRFAEKGRSSGETVIAVRRDQSNG